MLTQQFTQTTSTFFGTHVHALILRQRIVYSLNISNFLNTFRLADDKSANWNLYIHPFS